MRALPLKRAGQGALKICPPEEAEVLHLFLPGPLQNLHIPVIRSGTRAGTGCWSWNGNLDTPTLKPSILNDFRPHDALVNHIWVTDGKVQFLSDCSHDLAGQTLDLEDVPESDLKDFHEMIWKEAQP